MTSGQCHCPGRWGRGGGGGGGEEEETGREAAFLVVFACDIGRLDLAMGIKKIKAILD